MTARAPRDAAEIEVLLRRAWETGRGRWPRVDLQFDLFLRHVARLLPEEGPGLLLPQLFEGLDSEGLYLACACVNGVPGSIELLEQHYLAKLPAVIGYLKLSATELDELCQGVRTHLLVRMPEAEPRLAEYTGRGALMIWIRVIAVRMVLRQSASHRETPDDTVLVALEALPSPEEDAELELIKRRYRHEFRQAVRKAFSVLSSEHRYLLRLHFLDQLPTTKMGPMFGRDQSTVSRWLKEARKKVYEETKQRLKDHLRLSSQEFESLMNAIRSRFDMSLRQFLSTTEEAGDS